MSLRDLFPPLDPYAKGFLRVDEVHTLYWEECGNPSGIPILFLHGGPGAGATSTHRRFFDPRTYRIVIFDQRGSGRSEPLGETRNNKTEFLIQDIENLRQYRKIDRWHLFGGSWGSTLALAYAQTYPERCTALVLRGICLLQKREIEWFLYGIRTVFPEAWEKFSSFIPPEERHDLLAAYQRCFASSDHELRLQAIRTWAQYESSCSILQPEDAPNSIPSDERHRIGLATLEAHYFANNLFQPDSLLLDRIDRIRHIPGTIVQGRYDMICPIQTADELHKRWPEAEYKIISDAGHSALEPGICRALIAATEKYKTLSQQPTPVREQAHF